MRLLPAALGVLLLLALLTWLLLRGIDTNAPAYAMTLRVFDDFALAEWSNGSSIKLSIVGVSLRATTSSQPTTLPS
jgi:hypothetical protein